jgi:hypothetical protein
MSLNLVVSADDDLLEIRGPDGGMEYWHVDPGEEGEPSRAFYLEADPETPPGHRFELFLTITDGQANVWTDRFSLTEGAADISLALHDWQVSEVGGNGDGYVSAGEVGDLDITVQNTGIATAREVVATLETEDAHVRLDNAQTRIGSVGVNGTAPVESPFRFTVLASHPDRPVDFSITLSAGSYERQVNIAMPLGVEQ